MSRLLVLLYGGPIGVLDALPGGGSRFRASEEWRRSGYRPTLGAAWLQTEGDRSATLGLPAWFENLVPQRDSPLRRRICEEKGIDAGDSFGLLRALGEDLPGAVVVREVPPDWTEAEDELPTGAPQRPPRGRLHFSLAGLQLKFTLVLREGRLTLPARGELGQYLFKLPARDMPSLPSVERFTMRWARAAGFDVPDCDLHHVRDVDQLQPLVRDELEEGLLVRRYDRGPTGATHQEDFCQVFSLPPEHNYGRGDTPHPAERLVRFVRDFLGRGSATELVRRFAFVLASGNTDAHLKNWSLLLPLDGRPALAPLYDQVAVVALPDWGWGGSKGVSFALSQGGVRRMAEFDREALHRFSRGIDGTTDWVEPFFEGLERSRSAWHELQGCAILPLRAAIEDHWRAVPLLKEMGLTLPR